MAVTQIGVRPFNVHAYRQEGWVPLTTHARRYGVPERTLRRHAAKGRIGAVQFNGRWFVYDITRVYGR